MQATRPAAPRLLVIEDDPAIGELVEEFLGGEGYAVTLVTSGVAARAALARDSFALILTDALAEGFPDAERWQPLDTIRRAAPTVPVVICTAHRASAYADYAARGFAAMLTKPFDLHTLLAVIVHTIGDTAE